VKLNTQTSSRTGHFEIPRREIILPLHRYLYSSTLLGVFSAILTVRIGFDLNFFDILMLVNILPMFFLVNSTRVPRWMLGLVLYIVLSGCIGILRHTDSVSQVLKECLGITVSVFYFYYFFKLIRDDFERAFLSYTRISYWFAIAAFPIWVVSCIAEHDLVRLQGITPEPAAFCTLVLPAYYWYAYSYFSSRKHATETAVLTVAIILSGSSLGFISVALGLVFLMSGRGKRILAVPIVVGVLLGFVYAVSANFRLRVNDTFLAVASADVTGANLSTYALISNLFVTQQVLKESPIIGNGIGSHVVSHARFIDDIPGVEAFTESGLADFNATEASSLTLRCLSELGIVGYLGVLIFLARCYVGGPGSRSAISKALMVCFFLKLVRGGMYFPPEQFFFVFIYILNHKRFKSEVRRGILQTSFGTRAALGLNESLT
jgi:hypothetical protein